MQVQERGSCDILIINERREMHYGTDTGDRRRRSGKNRIYL